MSHFAIFDDSIQIYLISAKPRLTGLQIFGYKECVTITVSYLKTISQFCNKKLQNSFKDIMQLQSK